MSDNCPTGCSCNWKKPAHNERMTEFIRLLHHSETYIDQTPGRSGINGLQHALRCGGLGAGMAVKDAVFIGIVHDLGRPLNDVHHGEVIAEMVKDRVSQVTYDILRTHGSYQASIVHKKAFPADPWTKEARALARAEVASFATDYDGPELTVPQAIKVLELYLG